MRKISIANILFALLSAAALVGCGSAPTVRNSKIAANVQKISSLHFVYRQSDLQTKSSYGKGYVSPNETGFGHFGHILTERVAAAFNKYGVTVLSTNKFEHNEPIAIKHTGAEKQPLLLIYATSGNASTNGHATRISHVFSAQLIDSVQKKIVWTATIDTSTWSGKDFILKNASKTTYDEIYADELFKAVIERMKSDGLFT